MDEATTEEAPSITLAAPGLPPALAFRATEAALGVAASELFAALPKEYRERFAVLPALEGIRLDLLRLHAGAVDLAPLTTLLDAARLIGEDVGRLAEAQREVDTAAGGRLRHVHPPESPN